MVVSLAICLRITMSLVSRYQPSRFHRLAAPERPSTIGLSYRQSCYICCHLISKRYLYSFQWNEVITIKTIANPFLLAGEIDLITSVPETVSAVLASSRTTAGQWSANLVHIVACQLWSHRGRCGQCLVFASMRMKNQPCIHFVVLLQRQHHPIHQSCQMIQHCKMLQSAMQWQNPTVQRLLWPLLNPLSNLVIQM